MADIRGAIAFESNVVQTAIQAEMQPLPVPGSGVSQSAPLHSNNVNRNHQRTLAQVEDEYVHQQLRDISSSGLELG